MQQPDQINSSNFKPLPLNEKAIKISSGNYHSLILTESGKVFSYGVGTEGILGHGDETTLYEPKEINELSKFKIIDIKCGGFHCVAVTDSGAVYSWVYRLVIFFRNFPRIL